MRTTRQLSLLGSMIAALISGCAGAPGELATEEVFVAVPRGLAPDAGEAIRSELNREIETARVGTSYTFFLSDNQELLGSLTIPAGSRAYREKIAKQKLAKVYDRLDPEKAGGSQSVNLIATPDSVRKYRKTELPPRVIILGSPMVEDHEGGISITADTLPCDGCATNSGNSYGRMSTFPPETTVRWFTPRANYGNGPNHRAQIEHFLRYLLQEKRGPLVRLSSDARVVFRSSASQWEGEVTPQDDCTGSKEVAQDDPQPSLYDSDGKTRIVALRPDVSIKIRKPEASLLKGPTSRVLFLVDTSSSIVLSADDEDKSQLFDVIKQDLCEKINSMPFTEFAVCGFGGWKDRSARLSKHPCSVFSGLYWAEGSRKNRDQAIDFVNDLKAGGGTPTLEALQEAVKLEGPLTVVMYSDGIPTLGQGGQTAVLKFAESLADQGVTVNSVGVGALSAHNEDFDWSGGEFLARLAQHTAGEYFALD